jgi:hypothetical protein
LYGGRSGTGSYTLTVTNMAVMRHFEVTDDKFNVVGISNSENAHV